MDRRTFLECNSRGRGNFAAAPRGASAVRAQGAERRADPRPVRRRLVLDRGDRAAAAQGPQRHRRAESADQPASRRRRHQGRAVLRSEADRAGGAFVRRHDPQRGRRRSEGFGLGLCRSARPRCRRGLRRARSQVSTPPASAGIVWANDWGRLGEEAFLRDFAGDLPAEKARLLYAVQAPFKRSLLADKTTQAAWRSKPSFYAVSTEDRTINPDLERFMAKRMGAKTIEVKASHLGSISRARRDRLLDPGVE